MPSVNLDTADATELVELLHFLDDWLTVDHERLDASLQDFAGNRLRHQPAANRPRPVRLPARL